MNNLKKLRTELKLSQVQLSEYTGIPRSNLSNLENGDRPFRQIHIEKLTAFFGVTSDYLLGKSDYGFEVMSEDDLDPCFITEKEYEQYKENIKIEIFNSGLETDVLTIKTLKNTTSTYFLKYRVTRELKGSFSDYGINRTKIEIIDWLNKLDEYDLEKVLRFIKEFL